MKIRLTALLLVFALAVPVWAIDFESQGKDYISVGESVQAPVPLEGELMENMQLVSVVMPAMVDIVVQVSDDGKFRQLFAPSNLYVTSHSDMPVEFSLVEVKDDEGKLATFDAFLSAWSTDGWKTLLYDGSNKPLAAGSYDILIGRLEPPPTDDTDPANQLKLVLEGKANAANGKVGNDGDSFVFATTFKVTVPPVKPVP